MRGTRKINWVLIGWIALSSQVAVAATLELRDEIRERVIRAGRARIFSAPDFNDLPENLVDTLDYTNLKEMEAAGLTEAKLELSPWSDSYWPIYQGILANRYADPGFPSSIDFKENYDYVSPRVGKGELEHLSPAEKYDLLVGDSQFTLTRRMLEEGKRIHDREGKVETWMGICHGWAPASFMVSRPSNAVKVTAADGKTELLFYPADIKALATLLWANTNVPTRFIGGRCNVKKPETDPTGRPKREECLDNNPGTWHLAAVNQIGVAKRSFVMDTSYDYEVWNQPVVAYHYKYFNLITQEVSDRMAPAVVSRADFPQDARKSVRSEKATHLVGVNMEVTYGVETSPRADLHDSAEKDHTMTVRFSYDLELDSNGAIVGGEWLSRNHPDFLWVPEPGAEALSRGDEILEQLRDTSSWERMTTVPAAWRSAAKRSSQIAQPLAKVVQKLIQFAQ